MTRTCCLAAAFLFAAPSLAQASGDGTTVLVVVGAAGTNEYGARFASWADRWKQVCQQASVRFAAVGLDGGGPSDRQRLQDALARESRSAGAELWLVLLGHGTFDGRTAKLALRGADLSAEELVAWLAPMKRPLVVVHAGSASAPFLKALSGPDRVIVTATKSGREQNATRLGGFFVEAIVDRQADLDKDGQTSLLEAFLVASKRVQASFADAGLLATEHALLDDNGDGLGTPATFFLGLQPGKGPEGSAVPDGLRAHQMHLLRSDPERAMAPEVRRRRDRLERDVAELRVARPRLSDDEYYRRLEPLLLELARLYERRGP